ncbi:hypothetical protein G9A89_019895 [Geosiphon pyriformis]|nr:hypothetical protein G9A89_019895 [Geosiphon pyriformis]
MLTSCGSSLINNIPNVFQSGVGVLVADILGVMQYLSMSTFCQWKRLDLRGRVPGWFVSLVLFISSGDLASIGALVHHSILDIHLCNFGFANGHLVENGPGVISVYTDGSVKDLGSAGTCGGAAAYFSNIDLSVRARVYSLLSLTLAELQAIAFTLEYISTSSSVMLFMDSQASLNKEHICITIASKRLLCADFFADAVTKSKFMLLVGMACQFIANAHQFIQHLFDACMDGIIDLNLVKQFDMCRTFQVWYFDGGIHSGFFSSVTMALRSYFMKALYYGLYMALAKGFVLKEWVVDTVCLLSPGSDRGLLVINLVCEFAEDHQSSIWILTTKLRVYYKKHSLLPKDGFVFLTISGLVSVWFCKMVFDFGVRLGVHVCFGLYPSLVSLYFGFLHDFSVLEGLGA